MENTTETKNPVDKVKLGKHYIRIQEVGLSCLLVLPFVPVLFEVLLKMHNAGNLEIMTMFILGTIGALCIHMGQEKRDELRNPKDDGESWSQLKDG